MINEDAPTMSAGNGGFSGSAAATGPVAGFDPLLGSKKVKRRKYGTKKDVKEGVTAKYKGEKYKLLPGKVKKKLSGKGGFDGDYRTEAGKVKDYVTDKLGKTNTKRDGVKVPKGHQDESFIPEGDRHPRDQKELDRAKAYIKKHPKFGLKDKKDVKEDASDRYGKSNYLPFLISYDGAESYVLYGKSPAEIKIQLRKIYRPENHNKIKVKRLYPNEVIQWYWKKRQQALTDQ